MQSLDSPTLYARVDVLEADNQFCLMELEATEPGLVLSSNENASANFAQAIQEII